MVNMEGMSVRGMPPGATRPETPQQIYARVYLHYAPDATPPEVDLQFRPYSGIRSTIRIRDGRLLVRISDLLEGAPAPVLEALAHVLVGKLLRAPVSPSHHLRYRRYVNRSEVRRSTHLARQARGRKILESPSGRHYDLEAIFEDLNRRFFHGLMARPLLGWSRRASRSTLGHYDPSHNTIVLSRLLDRPEIPRLAVEYVLYHEMLHLRFPAEHTGTRRRVHTKQFREAEKQFPHLQKARRLLTGL